MLKEVWFIFLKSFIVSFHKPSSFEKTRQNNLQKSIEIKIIKCNQIRLRVISSFILFWVRINCICCIVSHVSSIFSSARFSNWNIDLVNQPLDNIGFNELDTSVVSVNKMIANLIPYPRIHFMSPAFSPFVADIDLKKHHLSVSEITESWLSAENYLVSFDDQNNYSLSALLSYWGDISHSDIVKVLPSAREKINLLDFTPNGILWSLSAQSPWMFSNDQPLQLCLSSMVNSGSIKRLFEANASKFYSLFSKRAFYMWYVVEGMENGEIYERRKDLASIIYDYPDINNQTQLDEDNEEAQY